LKNEAKSIRRILVMRLKKYMSICLCWMTVVLVTYAQEPVSRKPSSQKPTQKPSTEINKRWGSFSCTAPKLFYETKDSFKNYTRATALKMRATIMAQDPKWTESLPCCPETYDYVKEASIWETPKVSFAGCFHPGAYYDVRTSNLFHQVTSSQIGQQCTYTDQGKLISTGPGAGTPDFVSPMVDEEKHWVYDVYPWTQLTMAEYDSVWKPNPGCNSGIRYRLHPDLWSNLWMYVRRGDIISFTGAMGQIKFDVEGNVTGPEGSLAMPKTDIGLLGRVLYNNPLPGAPPGALIGAVYQGTFAGNNNEQRIDMSDLTAGFLIGRGAIIKIEASGYLVLGINDGFMENNTGWFEVTVQRSVHR
jgi:hypothetical protein